MKRPRSSKVINGEDAVSVASFDHGTEAMVDGSAFGPSPLELNSRNLHSHRSRQSLPSFPRNLLARSYIVAVFASVIGTASFTPLPVVDASMPTARGVAPFLTMTDLDSFYINDGVDANILFQKRRIEEQDASADEDSSSQPSETTSNIEECTVPAGKCELCNFSEQKTEEACHETGLWQKFECRQTAGSKDESSSDSTFKMKSCKYTDFDEGIAMIQFQSLCLLIGSLSIMSVRKQKRLTSSLFDRRKHQGANATRSNPTAGSNKKSIGRIVEDYDEIEFTPMTNQESERVSLVERMEII